MRMNLIWRSTDTDTEAVLLHMAKCLRRKYYHKKCNDIDILPYLDVHNHCTVDIGIRLGIEFFNNCRELTDYYEKSECYVFDDVTKLFTFAGRTETPVGLSNYISNKYKEDSIFIIWIR